MPFNAIHEYDAATAGNNTDIGGSNIAEGCAPSGINNALRELARQVRAAVANQGGDIASAATTSIGAASGQYVRVTGTTAIAAFGTVNAGVMRWVEFTGALTLTHNAASLRLPGASNIVTAAGDVGLFVSLGAGNWKCLHYGRADGSAVAGFGGTLGSADAGAAEGPDFIADRASASPAAADIIGAFVMRGRDSAGGAADYAKLKGKILDATNGSEDGAGILSALVAGADTPVITFGPGVQIGAPAGGDLGAGTLNVDSTIYQDAVNVGSFSTQLMHIRDEKASGTDGGSSVATTWTKHALDDVKTNEIAGASQASSVVTLSVGTYFISAWSTAHRSGGYKVRWRNTSDNVTAIAGTSSYDNNGGQYTQSYSQLNGRFTVSGGSKNFELQYWVAVAFASTGLGNAVGSGEVEVYAEALIWKIA